MSVHLVGTSGFASPAFRDSLDAESHAAADLLASYAGLLSAVEMESSFYREPSAQTILGWRRAGDGLRFAIRVPRGATHVQRLRFPQSVTGFADALAPLGDRVACLLFTTPPSMPCEVDTVRRVLDAVGGRVRTAWEFRHPSWSCPEVVDLLVEHGSTPVIVETLDGTASGELLPGGHMADKWELPFVYVRMRKERYRAREIMMWADVLSECLRRGSDVCVFFKQSHEATAYAVALTELLDEAQRGALALAAGDHRGASAADQRGASAADQRGASAADQRGASAPREPVNTETKQSRIAR